MPAPPALRLASKKKSLPASEQDTERVRQARADYDTQIGTLDSERFKAIDEAGGHLAMTRRDGRAPAGERVCEAVPQTRGRTVAVLGALSVEGVEAGMPLEGATDGEGFRAYVEQGLGPTLSAGDIVIMDNLRAPQVAGIQEAIERYGAQLVYLPPYSPELSPIEHAWSKLKTYLRSAKARTRQALEAALREALETISASDACHWFRHCGYTLQ